MGIKVKQSSRNILRVMFNKADKEIEAIIIRNFQMIGEYCIGYARDSGLYTDRTGNLRSSIGYVIGLNGKEIKKGGFDASKNKGSDGVRGAMDGYQSALKRMAELPHKYVLVVVAGMFYAEYVEKAGYDVLIATEIEAKDFARQLFNQLASQIKR